MVKSVLRSDEKVSEPSSSPLSTPSANSPLSMQSLRLSCKELFQYSIADPTKQRAVRRKAGKRPAEEEEDGPGPAKKVAKKSGAVNYEQLGPYQEPADQPQPQ